MNNLLAQYQGDVLQLFKEHYKKSLTKNVEVKFEDVLHETFSELSIDKKQASSAPFLSEWFNLVHNQGYIDHFLNRPITELIFHSSSYVQLNTLSERIIFESELLSEEDFQLSLEVLSLKNQISWNYKDPFASFSVKINGTSFRATLIHSSTSSNLKSKMFLRSISLERPALELFHLDKDVYELLERMIKEKSNVLISGGTGSGKTTLLRSLLNKIDSSEHIIVLEDTYEILNQHPRQTSFLANKEQSNKSLKDYCAYSLRMTPDRLIVGEMRSNEVVPFLLAMNTGHKGLMSTIHANSAADALLRVSLLFSLYAETKDLSFSLVTKLVCKNVDYVIHLEHKRITEICRVIGSEGETPFYERVYEAS